jgi:hypothetical protein
VINPGLYPWYYCREGDDELIPSLRPAPAPRIYVAPKVKKVKQLDTGLPDNKITKDGAPHDGDHLSSACRKNDPKLVRQLGK